MRKLITRLLLVGIVMLIAPQASIAQIDFGLTLGGNLSKVNSSTFKSNYGAGLQTGIELLFPLNNSIRLRQSLLFAQKGSNIDFITEEGPNKYDVNGKQRINYLELPLNLDLVAHLKENHSFILSLGGYIAKGIGGHIEIKNVYTNSSYPSYNGTFDYSMNMRFLDELTNDQWVEYLGPKLSYGVVKKWDYGLNFGVGYQINKALLSFGMVQGLYNIHPYYGNIIGKQREKNNRSFRLSLTHFLIR